MDSVAAELEFTAPLSTFACLQVGPQGLPALMRPSCTWPRLQSGPDGPEALSMRLPASSALASREIRRVNSPLIRHPRPASTPSDVAIAFGKSVPPDSLVPSSWFRTTSTAFSAEEFRACCIPVPEGVRRVSLPQSPLAARHLRRDTGSRPVDHSGPRCALHTPRRSSPAGSRIASLRPLPPRRCAFAPSIQASSNGMNRRPSTSGRCSAVGNRTPTPVASCLSASSFLGFVPLQGSG